jgi:hypothetical protein
MPKVIEIIYEGIAVGGTSKLHGSGRRRASVGVLEHTMLSAYYTTFTVVQVSADGLILFLLPS